MRKFFKKIEEGEDFSTLVFGYKHLPRRLLRVSFFPFKRLGIILSIENLNAWRIEDSGGIVLGFKFIYFNK